jgi:tetratricopeptide (TPR) repeat protein
VNGFAQNIVSRYVQRRVLFISLILLVGLFVITAALARSYHAREQGLVTEWYDKGKADLAAGKPAMALEDFRNSLSYGPENQDVQLHLAKALLADGQLTEAHSYLVNLWDRAPGTGEVNLDLARVSARMGDLDQAVLYYQSAILGSWDDDPAGHRRDARLELSELFLAHQRIGEAQAQLASLAAETSPSDGALLEQNGRLFLRVGEPSKALAEFEAALKTNPQQSEWLTAAGRIAFEEGEFTKAEAYFSRAERENPSEDVHESLELVRDVLANDPFLAGLSDEEQARRTLRDFELGTDRLHKCSPSTVANSATNLASGQPPSNLEPLDKEVQDLRMRVNSNSLSKDPDLRNETMQFVFRTEHANSEACGPATNLDQAMELIEKHREGNNP